jgi:hypothetical protein
MLSLRDMAAGAAQQQQQQPAAAAPAQPPVFKFGLDPGSNSGRDAQQAVAAAAAAAMAAVAAKHQQQHAGPADAAQLSRDGSGALADPLVQTYKLRLQDTLPRELQQALQQQQQQRQQGRARLLLVLQLCQTLTCCWIAQQQG